jgi:hypothetical protein
MAVIVNSHNPIYEETNNDRYPRPIFASPGTAHPNPRSYCTRQHHPSSCSRPPLSPLLLPLASSPLSRHPNRNRILYQPIWTPSSQRGTMDAAVFSFPVRRSNLVARSPIVPLPPRGFSCICPSPFHLCRRSKRQDVVAHRRPLALLTLPCGKFAHAPPLRVGLILR